MPMLRKKVLWIDDEVEFLRSHIMFLETRGYSVTPVFSGDDGLHLLRENPNAFDIVLLDEQMPGKDGLTVLAEIKERLPDLPVVMVTKSEEEDLMEKAIGKKIDGYLTKPVNPSQVLLVCKNLLHSDEIVSEQLKHSFVKSYSDVQTKLKRDIDYKGWIKLYQGLVRRELEIEDIDDESIRQGHAAQMTEASSKFADFVIASYPSWITGETQDKPLLSHEVINKFLAPIIRGGEKVVFLVLDSIRLDQYVVIQRLLRRQFQVNNYFYSSVLPTTQPHALSSLLTGKLPTELAVECPDLWELVGTSVTVWKELASYGFSQIDSTRESVFYDFQNDRVRPESIVREISREGKVGTVLVDFLEMFHSDEGHSKVLQEMAVSGKSFRKITAAWFEESRLFELLKQLSREEVTVVLTPSSGNILSTRSTEYYGDTVGYNNLRYRYGDAITCDERFGFLLTDPSRYGIPVRGETGQSVLLRENYYFVDHATYHEYNDQYRNSFERGGISLEEMILPLAILKPKLLDLDLDF